MDEHCYQGLIDIISSKEYKTIVKHLRQNSKEKEIEEFNIFSLFSDYYYRENFNSDILCEFLNPQGTHGMKTLFLEVFINVLNSIANKTGKEQLIDFSNYSENAIASRETNGRIDILISNSDENHFIIIENKINNAPDMDRQLPRYYKTITSRHANAVVDAIVYIPLSNYKEPNLNRKDREVIKDKYLKLPCDDSTNDSLIGWAKTSLEVLKHYHSSKAINAKEIIHQYTSLLHQISNNITDMNSINDFLKYLLNNPKSLEAAKNASTIFYETEIAIANNLKKDIDKQSYVKKLYFSSWVWHNNYFQCGMTIYKCDSENEYAVKVMNIGCRIKGFYISVFEENLSEENKRSLEKIGYKEEDGELVFQKNLEITEEKEVVKITNKTIALLMNLQ
jgi:hypothetical protein